MPVLSPSGHGKSPPKHFMSDCVMQMSFAPPAGAASGSRRIFTPHMNSWTGRLSCCNPELHAFSAAADEFFTRRGNSLHTSHTADTADYTPFSIQEHT
jgi:hypothetical protein